MREELEREERNRQPNNQSSKPSFQYFIINILILFGNGLLLKRYCDIMIKYPLTNYYNALLTNYYKKLIVSVMETIKSSKNLDQFLLKMFSPESTPDNVS